MAEKICAIDSCPNVVTGQAPNAKYCSDKCRKKEYNANYNKKHSPTPTKKRPETDCPTKELRVPEGVTEVIHNGFRRWYDESGKLVGLHRNDPGRSPYEIREIEPDIPAVDFEQ